MKIPMIDAGRGAERAQDRDVGALVGHRHHQRRDEVERGDRDDQRQDDEHHALFDLHRARTSCGSCCVQSRDAATSPPRLLRELARHLRRRVQVLQLQPHAGRRRPGGRASRRPRCGPAPGRCRIRSGRLEGADDGELLAGAARRRPASPGPAARSASPCRRRARRARAPARRRARCRTRPARSASSAAVAHAGRRGR